MIGAPHTIHTPETVIARLEDAGATLIALRVSGCRPAEYRTAWPEYVAEVITADSRSRLAPPTARAIGRMDECQRWINELVPDARSKKLLQARSLVHPESGKHILSWRRIGDAMNSDHKGAMYAHGRAAARLADALNLRFSSPSPISPQNVLVISIDGPVRGQRPLAPSPALEMTCDMVP